MTSLQADTSMFRVNDEVAFTTGSLVAIIEDMDMLVFFAELYKLTLEQKAELMQLVFPDSNVVAELTRGAHSTELQGGPDEPYSGPAVIHDGPEVSDNEAYHSEEVLKALIKAAEIQIADSIQKVSDKINAVISRFPTHQARMHFQTLKQFNVRRQSMSTYKPAITRSRDDVKLKTLVVLDDSGSMTAETIKALVHDVVDMSYDINASLILVSSTARYFEANTYTVRDLLDKAQYAGTNYTTLMPHFQQDWDVVVAIADYDSYSIAKQLFQTQVHGRIGELIDVSLVNQPTYLSECLATIADKYTPVLIGNSYAPLS